MTRLADTFSRTNWVLCVCEIGCHVQCSFSFIYYYYYYVSVVEWVRVVAYAVTFKRILKFSMHLIKKWIIHASNSTAGRPKIKICVRLRCMWKSWARGHRNELCTRSFRQFSTKMSVDLDGIKSRMADHTISNVRRLRLPFVAEL